MSEKNNTTRTYHAQIIFILDEEYFSRIEEVLEMWSASNVRIQSTNIWDVRFNINDTMKIFALKEIIESYGGKIQEKPYFKTLHVRPA